MNSDAAEIRPVQPTSTDKHAVVVSIVEWMRWNDVAVPTARLRPPFDVGDPAIPTTTREASHGRAPNRVMPVAAGPAVPAPSGWLRLLSGDGRQPQSQGESSTKAKAPDGPRRTRSQRRSVVGAQVRLGRLCLLRCDGPASAEGLCAGALARWALHARQHRTGLPLVQRQQMQRRGDRLAAAQTTRRTHLPVAPPRHRRRTGATVRGSTRRQNRDAGHPCVLKPRQTTKYHRLPALGRVVAHHNVCRLVESGGWTCRAGRHP